MNLIRKQKSYVLKVKHNSTLEGAFIWWLKRRNTDCRRFCPLCEYFYKCQEDVALKDFLEGD